MDRQLHQESRALWEWCLEHLREKSRWRFDGPTADHLAVILHILAVTWDAQDLCYYVEFDTIKVVVVDGIELEAAPTKAIPLPEWYKAPGPTPLMMSSTTFKEMFDTGRLHKLTPTEV